MALPDSSKLIVGTIHVIADTAGDYDDGDLGTGTGQIILASLASGAARQSVQFDLGANRDVAYTMTAAIEMDVAPTAGETVDFYLNFTPNATAGIGNMGGASGTDAAYVGYSSNLNDSLKQLVYIGSMVMTVQIATTVQLANIGSFVPLHRYASLIVDNNTGQAFEGDDVEMAILIEPRTLQVQD